MKCQANSFTELIYILAESFYTFCDIVALLALTLAPAAGDKRASQKQKSLCCDTEAVVADPEKVPRADPVALSEQTAGQTCYWSWWHPASAALAHGQGFGRTRAQVGAHTHLELTSTHTHTRTHIPSLSYYTTARGQGLTHRNGSPSITIVLLFARAFVCSAVQKSLLKWSKDISYVNSIYEAICLRGSTEGTVACNTHLCVTDNFLLNNNRTQQHRWLLQALFRCTQEMIQYWTGWTKGLRHVSALWISWML